MKHPSRVGCSPMCGGGQGLASGSRSIEKETKSFAFDKSYWFVAFALQLAA